MSDSRKRRNPVQKKLKEEEQFKPKIFKLKTDYKRKHLRPQDVTEDGELENTND